MRAFSGPIPQPKSAPKSPWAPQALAFQTHTCHLPRFPPCVLGKGMGVILGINILKGGLWHPLKLGSLGARELPASPQLVPVVGAKREGAGAWLIPAVTASPLPSGKSFLM